MQIKHQYTGKKFIFARDLCVGDTLCFTHSAGDVVIESVSEGRNPATVGLHANDDTWTAFYDKDCRMRVIRGAEGRAKDVAAAKEAADQLVLAPVEQQAFMARVNSVFFRHGTQPAIPLAHAQAIAHFAPPSSPVHEQVEEARRVRADLAINDMKSSGELRRADDRRAFELQMQWGTA